MILREMPLLSDENFRSWFYRHWGRENCVISALTTHAEYPLFEQRLSIKLALGGAEDYFIDGRRLTVDDDTFLILNDRRVYASRVRSREPVTSFSIFFRPGLAEEVARTFSSRAESLLDDPGAVHGFPFGFSEHLRRHDRQVTPVLQFIQRHVEMGVSDENWIEEQLYFLAQRMIALQAQDRRAAAAIPARRASTRKELFRRVAMAVDFINMRYHEPIGLRDIAAASRLSPYHCLRTFKAVHGVSPAEYLNNRRVQVATRLLSEERVSMDEAAAAVGFQGRTSLYRHIRRVHGSSPTALRASAQRLSGSSAPESSSCRLARSRSR